MLYFLKPECREPAICQKTFYKSTTGYLAKFRIFKCPKNVEKCREMTNSYNNIKCGFFENVYLLTKKYCKDNLFATLKIIKTLKADYQIFYWAKLITYLKIIFLSYFLVVF